MKTKKNKLFLFCFLFAVSFTYSQTTLFGKVESTENAQSIHVINKSRKQFATTNTLGEFKIIAAVNDTIVFSSIQHKPKSVIVSQEHINKAALTVKLEPKINELDEIVVGKVLTGDLFSDVLNSEAKPDINFYDVGILGYKGKLKTKSERLLSEAGDLKAKDVLIGMLTGSIPINPILNAISGRTKELKQRVELESKAALLLSLKGRLSKVFFTVNPLEEDKRMDFFYFCLDDENFVSRCEKNDLEALLFFKEKYKQYLLNASEKE